MPPGPNRPLLPEFVRVLDSVDWQVALLQEAPPRWRDALAHELHAESSIVLTSRNCGAPIRGWVADRAPNLIKSNEGGSNQLLVRAPWAIAETRVHTLARKPERRRMLWARLTGPDGASLAVANLHGSVDTVPGAVDQVLAAAALAVEWAGSAPLLFGGDLNLRATRQPGLFDALAERFGLVAPTARNAIDHLLVRGLEVLEGPRRAEAGEHTVDLGGGRVVQLSDHAYVRAALGI